MLMDKRLVIKNTYLYSADGQSTFDIFIDEGKIISVKPSGKDISQNGNAFDASGYTAIPGIIDIHIHGAGGSDSLDGNKQAFETISKTLARFGTTSFISAMIVKPGTENIHLKAAAASTGKINDGAELLGIYIEGPFINTAKRGGIDTDCITAPSEKILDEILDATGSALKIMCLGPELSGNFKIIKRLKEEKIIASFGHSDANYEEIKKGFDAGIEHVTHFFNAMRSIHHRDPGPIPAILENNNISIEIIADSNHVHPSLINLVRKIKDPGKIICISDGISGTGLPDGIYTYNNKQYRSQAGLATYLDGTFIGATMSLAKIVRNYKNFTSAGLKEAIDTVTINPARLFGIDNRKGSIDEGKDADIVLLDKDFNVQHTIIDGKVIV